jgi:hypothetical protein
VRFHGLSCCRSGAESPSVLPPHLEDTFASIEVDTDRVLLGRIAGELAMFPSVGVFVETIDDQLVIWGVGGQVFAVVDRCASNWPASRTEDARSKLFAREPLNPVELMNDQVPRLTVGIVQEVAPPAGMEFAVIRRKWSRSAPHVPVEASGRLGVFGWIFFAAGTIDETASHAKPAHIAIEEEFPRTDMMGAQAPM